MTRASTSRVFESGKRPTNRAATCLHLFCQHTTPFDQSESTKSRLAMQAACTSVARFQCDPTRSSKRPRKGPVSILEPHSRGALTTSGIQRCRQKANRSPWPGHRLWCTLELKGSAGQATGKRAVPQVHVQPPSLPSALYTRKIRSRRVLFIPWSASSPERMTLDRAWPSLRIPAERTSVGRALIRRRFSLSCLQLQVLSLLEAEFSLLAAEISQAYALPQRLPYYLFHCTFHRITPSLRLTIAGSRRDDSRALSQPVKQRRGIDNTTSTQLASLGPQRR